MAIFKRGDKTGILVRQGESEGGLAQLRVEQVLHVVQEVGRVQAEDVADLLEEVEDVGEGESLAGSDFVVVEVGQRAELLEGHALGLVELELDLRLELLDGDFGDLEGDFLGRRALLLLGEHDHHHAGDLQFALDESLHGLHVEQGEVGVVDVVLRVGVEEALLALEGEGQTLEGLVEALHEGGAFEEVAGEEVLLEAEEVLRVVDVVLLEGGGVEPDAVLEEGERGLGVVEAEGEPDVAVAVELEGELEEGAVLEELVADGVLDLGEDAEELVGADVREAADVLERVDHGRLQLDQRLDRHLVDLLERLPVDVPEVLRLELLDQFGVRALQVGPPDRAVLVQPEALVAHALVQQLVPLLLPDHLALDQSADHQRLLLAPGGLDAQQDVHVEDVQRHRVGLLLALVLAGAGRAQLAQQVTVEQVVGLDLHRDALLQRGTHALADLVDLLLVVLEVVLPAVLLHEAAALELFDHEGDVLFGFVALPLLLLLLLEDGLVDAEVAVEGLVALFLDALPGEGLVLVHLAQPLDHLVVHPALVHLPLHDRVQLQVVHLPDHVLQHLQLLELPLRLRDPLRLDVLLLHVLVVLRTHRQEGREHDTLDQGGQDQHDHHVERREETHHQSEVVGDAVGHVEGHARPPRLRQHLHQEQLRVDERPEVGVLVVEAVLLGRLQLVGLIEDLHAQHSQDVVGEQVERQELHDDGQDGHHVLEQVLQVIVEGQFKFPAAVTRQLLQDKTRPEDPEGAQQCVLVSQSPEELQDEPQDYDDEVRPAEGLLEVPLRTHSHDAEDEFHHQQVHEGSVQVGGEGEVELQERHCVDEGAEGEQRAQHPEPPGAHHLLQRHLGVDPPAEGDPPRPVGEDGRAQVGVLLQDPAELHELVDVLRRGRVTMVELSLGLSLRQMVVTVSTKRTRFSQKQRRKRTTFLMSIWKLSSPRVTKATMREFCILVSSMRRSLLRVSLKMSKMREPGMEEKMNMLRKMKRMKSQQQQSWERMAGSWLSGQASQVPSTYVMKIIFPSSPQLFLQSSIATSPGSSISSDTVIAQADTTTMQKMKQMKMSLQADASDWKERPISRLWITGRTARNTRKGWSGRLPARRSNPTSSSSTPTSVRNTILRMKKTLQRDLCVSWSQDSWQACMAKSSRNTPQSAGEARRQRKALSLSSKTIRYMQKKLRKLMTASQSCEVCSAQTILQQWPSSELRMSKRGCLQRKALWTCSRAISILSSSVYFFTKSRVSSMRLLLVVLGCQCGLSWSMNESPSCGDLGDFIPTLEILYSACRNQSHPLPPPIFIAPFSSPPTSAPLLQLTISKLDELYYNSHAPGGCWLDHPHYCPLLSVIPAPLQQWMLLCGLDSPFLGQALTTNLFADVIVFIREKGIVAGILEEVRMQHYYKEDPINNVGFDYIAYLRMIWTKGVPTYSLQGFTYHEDKHREHHFDPNPNLPYKLVSVLDISKVAEISAHLFHSHQLVLNEFNGHKNQRFRISTDHGLCLFQCLNGQGALHVASESQADGAPVKVGQPNHHSSYYFQIVPISEGSWAGKGCYIRTFCGKALEVSNSHTDNNTVIVQGHFTAALNQIWIIRPVEDEILTPQHPVQQLGENPYITKAQSEHSGPQTHHQLHHGFPQAGVPYRISPCWDQFSTLVPHHHSHQLHIQKTINHSDQFVAFEVVEQHSGKVVIHINGGQTVYHIPHDHAHDGAYLTAAHPKFEHSEYWHLERAVGGKHAGEGWLFRSFCGKYLDVEEGGNIGEGTAVVQWQRTNSDNQIWLIRPYSH